MRRYSVLRVFLLTGFVLLLASSKGIPAAWLLFEWRAVSWTPTVHWCRRRQRRNTLPRNQPALLAQHQQQSVALTSNTTIDALLTPMHLESAFRKGARVLEEVEQKQSQQTHRASPSFERSVEQVHALLDLSIQTERELVPVSSGIALHALEGLVLGTRRDLDLLTLPEVESQLDSLDELLLRVEELEEGASPTIQIVENMWLILRHYLLQQQRVSSSNTASAEKTMVDRSVRLLQNWKRWATLPQAALYYQPPPYMYVQKTLEASVRHRVKMTNELWELYISSSRSLNDDKQQQQQHQACRAMHSYILEILSYSGEEWEVRQCQVLQNMICLGNKDGGIHTLDPSERECLQALRASAQAGRVSDVAWLSRWILRHGNNTDATIDSLHRFFLEALMNCDENGSLLYMERLLLNSKKTSIPLNNDYLKMLLKKCSQTHAPGSGKRAKSIFHRARSMLNDDWQPDAECVEYVVSTYLREHSVSLRHVFQADRFVRSCVKDFGLHTTPNTTKPAKIFATLLQAYQSIPPNHTQTALRRADGLFRFFLVQHRDRRISSEEPGVVHLELILQLWRRHPNASMVDERTAEYSGLMRGLYQRGIIQHCPAATTSAL